MSQASTNLQTLWVRAAVAVVALASALVLGFLFGRSQTGPVAGRALQVDPPAERVVMEVAPGRAASSRDDGLETPQVENPSNSFKTAASRVRDAVVFIQVRVHSSATEESIVDAFNERFFRDRFPRSVGSGVVVSRDGYVATNYHVVEGARQIQITLTDKRVLEAELVGVDSSTDLAVLKVDESGLSSAVFGDSDLVDIGEWVLAVGNPFRLRSTVTAGIVSAVGRDVDIIADGYGIEDFIQTDAAINPGNSGGALVNLNGELIGINTAIATESGSNEGYGFAVPSNLVARVVADLIEHGEVQRGYLGVTVLPVSAERAAAAGLDRATGVELQEVAFGLAAHRAGLRAGDLVLSINDREISEPNQLQSVVARKRPGDVLKIRYWRNRAGAELEVRILGTTDAATGRWLSRRLDVPSEPEPDPHDAMGLHESVPEIGLLLSPVNDVVSSGFGVSGGAYILSVEADGPAAAAGMTADAVIVSVDNESVSSVADLQSLLDGMGLEPGASDGEVDEEAVPGRSILVETVRRDGTHFFYEVVVAGA